MVGQIADRRPGLRRRILEAAGWMLGGHGADLAIRLLSNLIMTRLLFPEAFGLMAVVISIHVGLALLTDAGIKSAIIRSANGEDEEFLRSAWTLQIIRGSVIWLIMLGLAGLLSIGINHGWLPEHSTMADPLMPSLLAVVGGAALLQGLESVNLHTSVRRIEFRRIVLIGIGGNLLSLPVMLLWVLHDRSVWALVAGMIAGGVWRLLLSHAVIPGPRMRLQWHLPHIRELFHFGKWITVASAASFISTQSDRLILGILFPGSVLGLYAIARLLTDAAEGVFRRLHGSLTLPVLSEVLRNDPETLRDKYYRFRLPIEVGAFLAAGILLVAGSGIVEALYDDRYREAGWMLQILALSMVALPFHLIIMAVMAAGDARTYAAVSLLHAASLLVALAAGFLLGGLQGAILGIALAKLPATAVVLLLAHRRGWMSPWREVRLVPLIAVGAVIGQSGLWFARGAGWIS